MLVAETCSCPTQNHISATPTDAVVVYFTLEGATYLYHREGCEMLRPVQAILHDADQPFVRGFTHGPREVALKIPRRIFREISGGSTLGKPQDFDFRGTGAPKSHASALAGLLKSTLAAHETDGELVAPAALGMFRILISDVGLGERQPHESSREKA